MRPEIERIRLLEDVGADAWPAAATLWLEGWRLGLDRGVTRRANSVLPNAAVADPDAMIAEVERRYRERGLPPCFKMTVAAEPGDLDDRLARKGYHAEGHSLVLVADAGRVRHPSSAQVAITLQEHPTRAWCDACWPPVRPAHEREALRRIVERIAGPRAFGLARRDGAAAGAALAVAGQGWVGLTAVHTLPPQRRRGVARSLLGALAAWARRRDVVQLYLQVETDNDSARRLYGAQGFIEAYRYHYRRPAA